MHFLNRQTLLILPLPTVWCIFGKLQNPIISLRDYVILEFWFWQMIWQLSAWKHLYFHLSHTSSWNGMFTTIIHCKNECVGGWPDWEMQVHCLREFTESSMGHGQTQGTVPWHITKECMSEEMEARLEEKLKYEMWKKTNESSVPEFLEPKCHPLDSPFENEKTLLLKRIPNVMPFVSLTQIRKKGFV